MPLRASDPFESEEEQRRIKILEVLAASAIVTIIALVLYTVLNYKTI